jgi:dTDP-4-dehydrorhamnose 3,5-epimerase-like enzyme
MIKLAPYMVFEDERGSLKGITRDQWAEVNIIETRAGELRGGHYHRETLELFYILSGEINISIRHLTSGEAHQFTVREGDIFVVEPLEIHTFHVVTDSSWINMLSVPMDPDAPDIHREEDPGPG